MRRLRYYGKRGDRRGHLLFEVRVTRRGNYLIDVRPGDVDPADREEGAYMANREFGGGHESWYSYLWVVPAEKDTCQSR